MTTKPVIGGTFAEVWRNSVQTYEDRHFLSFLDDAGEVADWTYGEFDRVVAEVAGTLRYAGVLPGSAVHVVLRNCPAFVALWLAVARMGAWMVPVDPASTARDIASQVARVRPAVAVIARPRASVYRTGAAESRATILELDETAADMAVGSVLRSGGLLDGDLAPRPDQRLAVMFTSGTTSEPKGVVLTQQCYATVAQAMAEAAGLEARHRWLVTLPLFHANAQYYCFAPSIWTGAGVVLTSSFSASAWVSQARELGATHASLFAAPIRMILARTPSDEQPASLEHVWYAQNLGAEHHRAFGKLAGTLPRQLYGMTETVAVVTADRSEPPVHDLIGPPVRGRRVRIVDVASREPVTANVRGELEVYGFRGHDLFQGYLDAPEIDAQVFEAAEAGGVWFRTGDLVTAGPDGAIRFAGRIDDVIKVAGENVSLVEIEATLAEAPGVLEVAVVAEPDPVRDTVPVAYVVAKDSSQPPSLEDLKHWATQNLTPPARPRVWHFVSELPRTSVGKLRRFRLQAGKQDGLAV